jgi:hypothetical protein
MVTIALKAFFRFNHCDLFIVRKVEWPAVPRIGDDISVGYARPFGKVESMHWNEDGSANVYLELPNDFDLYRALQDEAAWQLQDTDPMLAS